MNETESYPASDVTALQKEKAEPVVLPSYWDSLARCEDGTASALDLFIRDNEPGGGQAEDEFRAGLAAVLRECRSHSPRRVLSDEDAKRELLFAHCRKVQEDTRHACSIAVWMTLQEALEPGADDKGLDGWMREAERRVRFGPPNPQEGMTTHCRELSDEASLEFAEWLAREMPPGTVINDPRWWAPRIVGAVLRAAGGEGHRRAQDHRGEESSVGSHEALVGGCQSPKAYRTMQ